MQHLSDTALPENTQQQSYIHGGGAELEGERVPSVAGFAAAVTEGKDDLLVNFQGKYHHSGEKYHPVDGLGIVLAALQHGKHRESGDQRQPNNMV